MRPTLSSSSASLAPAAPQQGLPSGAAAAWASDGAAPSHHQLAISNGVLLTAVIFLFMVVVFVFLLYLYAKRYLGTSNPLLAPSTPSSRFLFVAASPLPQRGLPAAVLRSLPVTVYGAAGSPRSPGVGSARRTRAWRRRTSKGRPGRRAMEGGAGGAWPRHRRARSNPAPLLLPPTAK